MQKEIVLWGGGGPDEHKSQLISPFFHQNGTVTPKKQKKQ